MREYSRLNMACCTHLCTTSLTSACEGHSSESITGLPSRDLPTGSFVKSMLTVPASAYATTSGGEPRELAFTSGWMRDSKLRLPDRTATTLTSSLTTAASISGVASGPELPMHVVHPKPTR